MWISMWIKIYNRKNPIENNCGGHSLLKVFPQRAVYVQHVLGNVVQQLLQTYKVHTYLHNDFIFLGCLKLLASSHLKIAFPWLEHPTPSLSVSFKVGRRDDGRTHWLLASHLTTIYFRHQVGSIVPFFRHRGGSIDPSFFDTK